MTTGISFVVCGPVTSCFVSPDKEISSDCMTVYCPDSKKGTRVPSWSAPVDTH